MTKGRETLIIFLSVLSICCWVLQSEMKQFPNQDVMQLQRLLLYSSSVVHGEDGDGVVSSSQYLKELKTLQDFLGNEADVGYPCEILFDTNTKF